MYSSTLGAAALDHQPGVEDAAVVDAARGQLLQGRLDRVAHDRGHERVVDAIGRRDRAHAAGVRPDGRRRASRL